MRVKRAGEFNGADHDWIISLSSKPAKKIFDFCFGRYFVDDALLSPNGIGQSPTVNFGGDFK
jgi:hypothetical protein